MKNEAVPIGRRFDALGSLQCLPDEILSSILDLLQPRDVGIVASVSSVLYILCNEEPLWMNLCLRDHEGLIEYKSCWKQTYLEKLKTFTDSEIRSFKSSLHFDGFSSLFLYKRWYRCNIELGSFWFDSGVIERRQQISKNEFTSLYDGKKPVLLTDLVDSWPAIHCWSINQLVERYGEIAFKVSHNHEKKILMKLKDYAAYMNAQHDEEPLYIFDAKFGEVAPGLLEDYKVPYLFEEDLFEVLLPPKRPPFRWLVIGPARSGASWHVDPALTSAWNTLLVGKKRWAMYPPGRVPPGVVVHVDEEDGDIDFDGPTSLQWWLEVYPFLRAEDKPLECTQLPGETIFVPSGWWHCVLNIEMSIAVTQNFVNPTNFELVCLEMAPGYQHRGIARAGNLAINDYNEIKNGELASISKENEWSLSVDTLAMYREKDGESHYVSNSTKNGYLMRGHVRDWLRNLWLHRPDLRQSIWKGACLALDAGNWLNRVTAICKAHGLPLPNEEQQLPVGNGSNPVFIIGNHVIKLYITEDGGEPAIVLLGSELHFYAELGKTSSSLKDVVPALVASGILICTNGDYETFPWDGTDSFPQLEELNYDGRKRPREEITCSTRSKARWCQAILNTGNDNGTEVLFENPYWPYIITKLCKGDDLQYVYSRMDKGEHQHMAEFLGRNIQILHKLPIPSCFDISDSGIGTGNLKSISGLELETNGHHVNGVFEILKVPKEWQLFVGKLRKQRETVREQLEAWDSTPTHLIEQVEAYLPLDPVVLVGIDKAPVWLHMDIMDDNIKVDTSKRNADGGYNFHILDFGDVSLGDPLYELIAIHLDAFKGDHNLLRHLLKSYELPLSLNIREWMPESEDIKRLSYRAMCYCILHTENALSAVFRNWKELKRAKNWREVEDQVWGALNDYKI